MRGYYVSSAWYILGEIKYSKILYSSHSKWMSTKQSSNLTCNKDAD